MIERESERKMQVLSSQLPDQLLQQHYLATFSHPITLCQICTPTHTASSSLSSPSPCSLYRILQINVEHHQHYGLMTEAPTERRGVSAALATDGETGQGPGRLVSQKTDQGRPDDRTGEVSEGEIK